MWEFQYPDELYHYGVKGMKWGVRRYQNKDGTLTAAGKKRNVSSNKTGTKKPSSAKSLISSNGNKRASDAIAGLGEELLVELALYAAVYAAMYGYARISVKKRRAKKAEELEERNKNKEIKSFDECPKLKNKMSPAENAKATNPEYPSMGTTMNCTFCTTAMALREKGYDVKAAKLDDGWYSDDLFKATFNSPEVKMKPKQNASSVLKELSDQGDGAYGNMTVSWKLGGAHSIFWKNENGTTNIYDGQSGKEYTSFSDKKMLLGNVNLSNIRYNRLDNCEPTDYALAVVERAEQKK